jgi:integrase/recombinase XerD
MNELLNKMKMNLEIAGSSHKTQDNYLRHIKHFQSHFGKKLENMGYDEVREFLHHAIIKRKLSCSYVNQAYSAIRFFYETILGWNWNMKLIPRVKRKKTLPAVLSAEEVKAIFTVTKNVKHKAILMTTYAAGLRVGEVTNLREKPISIRTVQQIFYNAIMLAGINKDVSIHTLRHCFATHLLEAGTNILHIQQLLGHSNIQSTCLYLHLCRMDVLKVRSPLDLIIDEKLLHIQK